MQGFLQALGLSLLLFFPAVLYLLSYLIKSLTRGCKEGKHKFVPFLVEYTPPVAFPGFKTQGGVSPVDVIESFGPKKFEVRCEKCGCKPNGNII